MKFYGIGQVWDNQNKRLLCVFEGSGFDRSGYEIPGVYETEDKREIEILTKMGYESDSKKAKTKLESEKNKKIKENLEKTPTIKSESEVGIL